MLVGAGTRMLLARSASDVGRASGKDMRSRALVIARERIPAK